MIVIRDSYFIALSGVYDGEIGGVGVYIVVYILFGLI